MEQDLWGMKKIETWNVVTQITHGLFRKLV